MINIKFCKICGNDLPEGRPICPPCEKSLGPPAEIIDAMLLGLPVEYKGEKYGCISAFTIRTRISTRVKLKKPYISEVELMSGRANCVIFAEPQAIKILKEGNE